MSEHDNDSISQFFRNASRKPQIEFREEDWQKMEAMLDASQRSIAPRKNQWPGTLLSVAAFLFTISGFFYFISEGNPAQWRAGVRGVQHEIGKGAESLTRSKPHHYPTLPEGHAVSQLLTGEPENVEHGEEGDHLSATSVSREAEDAAIIRNAAVVETTDASGNEFVNSNDESADAVVADTVAGEQAALPAMAHVGEINAADSAIEKKKPSASTRWSVMLAAAPDFSSTGMHQLTAPGQAAAVRLYYHLTDAWSVSVGVSRSNKRYNDSGTNYQTADANFWNKKTNGVVADRVLGSCTMLEIPIGIRYDFSRTARSRLYAAANVAAYFMSDEYYRYVFESSNPGAMTEWHSPKTSHALAGIVTMAFGYERNISKSLLMGISPYADIPLANMGVWSNTKLYSMGAAFTLRYRFQKRRDPDAWIMRRSD